MIQDRIKTIIFIENDSFLSFLALQLSNQTLEIVEFS